MVAYTYRMPTGIPGDINRGEVATVEAQAITPYGSTGAPAAYGIGVLIDATTGLIRIPAAGDTTMYGILVREYPIQGGQADALGSAIVPVQGACSVLVRGYISVILGGTTAASKTASVYLRIAGANGTTKIVGQFEAAADGGNTIQITNARWTGAAGSDGISELAYNI